LERDQRAEVLLRAGKDEPVARVGHVLAGALERSHETARGEVSFREEQRFQCHTEPVGGGAQRQEAAIEARAARLGRGQVVGREPSGPAHPLVVALDQEVAQQVARRTDGRGKRRRAERGDHLGPERQDDDTAQRGAAVELRRRQPVDDVGVELVGDEARVVHPRRDPELQPGAFP